MVIDYFPVLKDLHVIRMWSGLIAGMSDGIPVLGLTKEVPGFVFCTGFSGHGFGLAPVIGRLMAELILDCQVSLPIDDFCYYRFGDGKDRECSCAGNATCTINTAVCPKKRAFIQNV
jgi:sarcosine oxidase subunit beta